MVVIRLCRTGSKNRPKYRLAVADSRKPVKGRFIEIIGHYDPLSDPSSDSSEKKVVIDKDRYRAWLKKGAKPSRRVQSLFAKLS